MEYFRDPKNRIQADMAYRLGIVSSQYSTLDLPEDCDFSATLDISILQNVLTNCFGLLESMSRNERRKSTFREPLESNPIWGINTDMVVSNTFHPLDLKMDDFLRHLRNALSHPTQTEPNFDFPSTGYTTIPDDSGRVHQYCFVTSPDTRSNRPKLWIERGTAEKYLERGRKDGTMPSDVVIESDANGKFVLQRYNKAFARIFIAKLSVDELHKLVLCLCNHLAQPIQEFWDGYTIIKLVA